MTKPHHVVRAIEDAYSRLSPRARQAARYIQKNPTFVALYPLRQIAAGARVSPSTLVRLAAEVGFPSYNAFKDAFRNEARSGSSRYAENATRLSTGKDAAGLEKFYGSAIQTTSHSLEILFRSISS